MCISRVSELIPGIFPSISSLTIYWRRDDILSVLAVWGASRETRAAVRIMVLAAGGARAVSLLVARGRVRTTVVVVVVAERGVRTTVVVIMAAGWGAGAIVRVKVRMVDGRAGTIRALLAARRTRARVDSESLWQWHMSLLFWSSGKYSHS